MANVFAPRGLAVAEPLAAFDRQAVLQQQLTA